MGYILHRATAFTSAMHTAHVFENLKLEEIQKIRNMLFSMCHATYNVDEDDAKMISRRFRILLYSLLSSRNSQNTYSITCPYLLRCIIHPDGTDLESIDPTRYKLAMHGKTCSDDFKPGSRSGYFKFRITMRVLNPTWDIRFEKSESTGTGTSTVEFSFSEFEFTEPLEKSGGKGGEFGLFSPLHASAQSMVASFREAFNLQ